MSSRLWQMLSHILREIIESDRDVYEDEEEIREALLHEGFDDDEIEQAFDWLENYFSLPPPQEFIREKPKVSPSPRGLRVLSFDERMSIDPEAYGFLMNLEARGLIAPDIKEEILHRSMSMFDESIGVEEMRLVALMTIFEQGEYNIEDLIKMVEGHNLKSIH